MSIVLDGTTGITTPDINTTAQSTDIISTGDISAVDATLSGGVYLGGTGAANYLDDYEEGAWTLTTSTSGYTISSQSCAYTKVGRQVTVVFSVTFSAVNGSSNAFITINGLPFTTTGGTAGAVRESTTAGDIFVVFAPPSQDYIQINAMDGISNNSNAPLAAGKNYFGALTYFTS
jgi:hypothetical protein